MIIKTDINMSQNKVPPILKVSQYDNTIPKIQATLWDDDILYEIPDGSTVYIEGTKADHTGFQYACNWEGSTVTADVTQQMCAFEGRIECEFVIKRGEERKGTQNFFIEIERAALKEDIPLSETDIPLIERLDDVLNVLDETIEDAEAWANGTRDGKPVAEGDEAYRNNAKYHSQNAEAWAVGKRDNEDVPTDDETYHNNAKYWAERAEDFSHINDFEGASESQDGTRGLVPAPNAGEDTDILQGDGTWSDRLSIIENMIYTNHYTIPIVCDGDYLTDEKGNQILGDWKYIEA